MMRVARIMHLAFVKLLLAMHAVAEVQDAARNLTGPATTPNQLADERGEKPDLARANAAIWNTRKSNIRCKKDLEGRGWVAPGSGAQQV